MEQQSQSPPQGEGTLSECKQASSWCELDSNSRFRRINKQHSQFARYAVGFWNSPARRGSLVLGMSDSWQLVAPLPGFGTSEARDQFRLQLVELLQHNVTPCPLSSGCMVEVYFLPCCGEKQGEEAGVVIKIDLTAPEGCDVVFACTGRTDDASDDAVVWVRWGASTRRLRLPEALRLQRQR